LERVLKTPPQPPQPPQTQKGRGNRRKHGRKPKPQRPKKAASAIPRLADGKFQKGFSGNPNGKPVVAAEVKELARVHGPEAIARLAELMRSPDGATAIAACRELLNRGYGKAEQTINSPGGPLVSITMGSGPLTPEQAYALIVQNPEADIAAIQARTRLIEAPSNKEAEERS